MAFGDYFYSKYLKYSYDSNINLARSYYDTLCNSVGSSDAMQLLCIVAGANEGVTLRKYNAVIDITNDRGSYGMFASLAKDMHTPYMVKRVCNMFSGSNDTMSAAINFVYLFASLSGRFTEEDELMCSYIMGEK